LTYIPDKSLINQGDIYAMNNSKSFSYPWVVFSTQNTVLAISAENVQSMVITPQASAVPYTPEYVRGVVNLRGVVVPLYDLRVRLGMTSFLREIEDFCSLMDQREQDHKNWLRELEASVREQRDFTLATDPCKCAFGKWYDAYKPESYTLKMLMRKFDAPHRIIHSIAAKALSLEKEGDAETALKVIESCRNKELAELIRLFDKAKKIFRQNSNEVAVVIEHQRNLVALAVDKIESVEHLNEQSLDEPPETFGGDRETELVRYTARRKDGSVVLVLDLEKLFRSRHEIT
jgi:purine-binding chemotaxis protein CheW